MARPWPSTTPASPFGPGRVTGFLGPNGAGKSTTLEEAFFDLTRDETDYHATRLTGVTTGL